MASRRSDSRAEFDGLAFSAAIVNEMSSEDGDDLLGKIAERDETRRDRIREAMFTFEDLQRIAAREMGNLLRAVQSETLVTALQTATAELHEHFLSSLSQRAAATLARRPVGGAAQARCPRSRPPRRRSSRPRCGSPPKAS